MPLPGCNDVVTNISLLSWLWYMWVCIALYKIGLQKKKNKMLFEFFYKMFSVWMMETKWLEGSKWKCKTSLVARIRQKFWENVCCAVCRRSQAPTFHHFNNLTVVNLIFDIQRHFVTIKCRCIIQLQNSFEFAMKIERATT